MKHTELKMCILGCVILLFFIFVVALAVISVHGMQSAEAHPTLTLAVQGTEPHTLSFTVTIQNPPQDGVGGLLFFVEIGCVDIGNLTLSNTPQGFHVTHHIQKEESTTVGILLDAPTPHILSDGAVICQINITLDDRSHPFTLSILGGEILFLDQNQAVTTKDIPPLDMHIPTPQPEDDTSPLETEGADDIQSPSKNVSLHGVFIGVQNNLCQVQANPNETYALRFLFAVDASLPYATFGNVFCIRGGDVLCVEGHVKSYIRAFDGQMQTKIHPPMEGYAWLTYTFIGLSFQKTYTFEVHDSQGCMQIKIEKGELDTSAKLPLM